MACVFATQHWRGLAAKSKKKRLSLSLQMLQVREGDQAATLAAKRVLSNTPYFSVSVALQDPLAVKI